MQLVFFLNLSFISYKGVAKPVQLINSFLQMLIVAVMFGRNILYLSGEIKATKHFLWHFFANGDPRSFS